MEKGESRLQLVQNDHAKYDAEKTGDARSCDNCGRHKRHFLTAAFVIVAITVCMETMYILHLQKTEARAANLLHTRMDEIEARLSECSCDGKPTEKQALNKKMEYSLNFRHKRSTGDATTERPHEAVLHHGIPDIDIALLYADPDKLRSISENATATNPLRFVSNISKTDPLCSYIQKNRQRDLWCVPHHPGYQRNKFMLFGHNSNYPYFATAPWMTSDDSNFAVTLGENKRIKVKESGIYIVTSSMHFLGNPIGTIDYGVYARNQDDDINTELTLGLCAASIGSDNSTSGIYPCSTWQLVPLKANYTVFMKINPFHWFEVDKHTFFLALIKLNDWEL